MVLILVILKKKINCFFGLYASFVCAHCYMNFIMCLGLIFMNVLQATDILNTHELDLVINCVTTKRKKKA